MNNPNITRLVLLKTSLENDYKHTIWFGEPDGDNTKTNQTNYFLSKKVKNFDFTNLTYIRKDHSVKVPAHYDDVIGANYVMYQNSTETKWYYAFITDIKYISEGVTELILETDCIQTWMFAYAVQPSFVEREHVSDDTVGLHTYPEQVELGEHIVHGYNEFNLSGAHVVLTSTWDFRENEPSGSIINGIHHGVTYYLIGHQGVGGTAENIRKFMAWANTIKTDSITGMFMVPDELTGYYDITDYDGDEKHWDYVNKTSGNYYPFYKLTSEMIEAVDFGKFPISKPTTLDGYTPRNNKLLTFPYQYINMSNNNGGNAIYKWEDFDNPDDSTKINFQTYGAITPGCSIRTIPLNYKNREYMYEEGLNLGKYPICSFNSDIYTNWLTQNALSIGIDVGTSFLQTAVGGATGSISGVIDGLAGITSVIKQVNQMSFVPPQAKGNLNCGDVNYSMKRTSFTAYKMCIKNEYAKIIDNYFDMFGYKVCRVKTPNKNHRAKYWYIKTIDVNIDGGVPQKDLQKIKDAYNNGITFWRYEGNIGLYKDTANYNKISKTYV